MAPLSRHAMFKHSVTWHWSWPLSITNYFAVSDYFVQFSMSKISLVNKTLLLHNKCLISLNIDVMYLLWTTQWYLHFTPPHPLIPTPTRLLGKYSARLRLFTHIFPPRYIARYWFIQLNELWNRGETTNAQALKWQQRWFETSLSRLRVNFYRWANLPHVSPAQNWVPIQ